MPKIPLRVIASHAGVSISTVSRALNDDPRISEDTKAAIKHTLDRLTEKESNSAGLSTVGLFLLNMDGDPFFSHVIRGATKCANERNAYLLVERFVDGGTYLLPRALVRRRVEGAVVGSANLSDETVRAILAEGLPTVFIGRYLDKQESAMLNAVMSDNVTGGRLGVRHLLDSGYMHIIVVTGNKQGNHHLDRLDGVQAEFSARAHDGVLETVTLNGFFEPRHVQHVLRLVRAGKPVGIFCLEDNYALRALRLFAEHGVHVPKQVGVMGYNGLEVTEHVTPPLSTVGVPKTTLGYLAVQLLFDIGAGRVQHPTQIRIQPRLVARESTRLVE